MVARDPRISDVFYFFEQFTTIATGRTVGRKIGVVQEIIIKKHLLSSRKIRDCLLLEPLVTGKSGADHKVEFVLYRPLGVFEVPFGRPVDVPVLGTVRIRALNIELARARLNIDGELGEASSTIRSDVSTVNPKMRQLLAGSPINLKVTNITAKGARISVLNKKDVICTIESKRVGAQRFAGSDALGSGIQTIEKAKQASLVAIDVDLRQNGKILPQRKRGEGSYISVVVLGNGVHWTDKDIAILGTYVDFVYLVPDKSIIRYAKHVMAKAAPNGVARMDYFMSYFNGLTRTPPDDFEVSASDFEPRAPKDIPALVKVLERQIGDYAVKAF